MSKLIYLDNRDYAFHRIAIYASETVNDDTNRTVDAVELVIGHEDKRLEECKRIKLTRKEWKKLRANINEIFNH